MPGLHRRAFTRLGSRRGLRELDRNARQHLRDDGRRREVLESRLRLKDEAVRKRRRGQLLHVVRQDEVAALHERERRGRSRERVAFTTLTTYAFTGSAMCTSFTAVCISTSSSAPMTCSIVSSGWMTRCASRIAISSFSFG